MILTPFPAPPGGVENALTVLDIVARGDPEQVADLGSLQDLPRPWLPASCPPDLRLLIWRWCDAAAGWINREYAWRPAAMIPACWPKHPHLAAELPVLTCLRHAAELAVTPDQLEEWHRYTLPCFLDRMAARLGESTCRTGRHGDWPGAARHDAHLGDEARADRCRAFDADSGRAKALPA